MCSSGLPSRAMAEERSLLKACSGSGVLRVGELEGPKTKEGGERKVFKGDWGRRIHGKGVEKKKNLSAARPTGRERKGDMRG